MNPKASHEDLEWLDSRFHLEHFLKSLTLEPMVHTQRAPPMPKPKARSAMTPLIMKPGGYRKLREVKRIDALEDEVTFFFNNLNAESGDGMEFKTLVLASQIPAAKIKETLNFNPYEVNNRSEVLFAVERGPLMSVQTLVHTIDEELQEWKFHTPRRNGTLNNQSVEPTYFTKLDASQGMESVKCIVVPFAPWEFTPQDFDDFTSMCDFIDGNQSMNGEGNSPPWKNADKMWAYLHDLCLIHDCRHFVLTTYEQWTFGGFSTFFTTSFVSDVKSWDASPNSVVEIFTYWLLTACSFPNTIMLHEVPREKHIDSDLFEKDRMLHGKRVLSDNAIYTLPDFPVQVVRPTKRARRDPIEEYTGWQRLSGHTSKKFSSPRKAHMYNTSAAERNGRKDLRQFALAKPCAMWNGWQRRREAREKENWAQRERSGL